MAGDGVTHFISDFAGIGLGFRDTNIWLGNLTNFVFSNSFYVGDAFGSFNSWMRLITGILFGIGFVWLAFPLLDETFSRITGKYEEKYKSLENLSEETIKDIFANL